MKRWIWSSIAIVSNGCHVPSPPRAEAPRPGAVATDAPRRIGGFDLPESARWDERADVYLVSNIGGAPFAEDDDGWIASVAPDSGVVRRLVDGATPDVRLDSPRGLALLGDTLYVADLGTVRGFDRTTGAVRGAWPIDGAVMLNDVVADGDALYVSDSGMPPARQPAGAHHAIYRLVPATGAITTVMRGADLGRPNGLVIHDGALWVATYATGVLGRVCGDAICDAGKLPGGGLDGLAITADGTWFASSQETNAVYAGAPGGSWRVIASDLAAPADLGWDATRARLLVPLLEQGELAIIPVGR